MEVTKKVIHQQPMIPSMHWLCESVLYSSSKSGWSLCDKLFSKNRWLLLLLRCVNINLNILALGLFATHWKQCGHYFCSHTKYDYVSQSPSPLGRLKVSSILWVLSIYVTIFSFIPIFFPFLSLSLSISRRSFRAVPCHFVSSLWWSMYRNWRALLMAILICKRKLVSCITY